jgi:hypothetical protein
MLHNFSDGLYAKEMLLPKGTFAVQHKHTYDHLSILAKGKVQMQTYSLLSASSSSLKLKRKDI